MNCEKCNKENDDFDNYCRMCGEPTGREYFECECGSEVESEDNYCHDCGMKFEGVEEVEEESGAELEDTDSM